MKLIGSLGFTIAVISCEWQIVLHITPVNIIRGEMSLKEGGKVTQLQ